MTKKEILKFIDGKVKKKVSLRKKEKFSNFSRVFGSNSVKTIVGDFSSTLFGKNRSTIFSSFEELSRKLSELFSFRIFTEKNDLAQTFQEALKFSTNQAQRPFSCRLQQSLVSVIQTTIWLTFGSSFFLSEQKFSSNKKVFLSVLGTGIFLLIIFLIKRRSKQRENQEKLYKKLVEEILDAVRIQHEEHLENPQNDPWVAVSHVRDTLIPPADR